LFWTFAAGAVVSAYLVFRTDSMVRAAYWLLASFVAVGAILVLLGASFLGLVLILMMAGEMTIMAFVMVMFMMNPAGLNPMVMVHQHKTAIACGVGAFVALSAAALKTEFPGSPVQGATRATQQLGVELLGNSMLVFETAGVALLATMIGVVAVAATRGRFGDAEDGSIEPALQPDEVLQVQQSVEGSTPRT
jgi:NADH-quinone oxidoreductase subunit J